MKFNSLFRKTFVLILLNFMQSYAQVPVIEWQKTFGGSGTDRAFSVRATLDGGYIVAGTTASINGDVTLNQGYYDLWIVKLDADGNFVWQKTYGGSDDDRANMIECTVDGGYIVAGYSSSYDGDIGLNYGVHDFWILKLDQLGNIQWEKNVGGTYYEQASSIKETPDGGFIVAGFTESNTGNFSGNHGESDFLVVKLSSSGYVEWRKMYGGSLWERANDIQCTPDGGYIVTGYAESIDGDLTTTNGNDDFWVVKLDALGVIQWERAYGGTELEIAHAIQLTNDGGYIVGGISTSNNGDVGEDFGGYDYWIIKIDAFGVIEWSKVLGGAGDDILTSLKATSDNGCIISGYSKNSDIPGNYGQDQSDWWIVRLSGAGNLLWQKVIGGSESDKMEDVALANDGSYILSGSTNSSDGDVTSFQGYSDSWVVKLTATNLTNNSFAQNLNISIFPNPTKEKITLKLDYFHPSQEISISNILGKTIYNQKLNGLTTTINTSNFQKGIYFLNLVDGIQKTTRKFIID